jgi:hypothetical protein
LVASSKQDPHAQRHRGAAPTAHSIAKGTRTIARASHVRSSSRHACAPPPTAAVSAIAAGHRPRSAPPPSTSRAAAPLPTPRAPRRAAPVGARRRVAGPGCPPHVLPRSCAGCLSRP